MTQIYSFGVVDYVIFAIVLILSALIGVFFGCIKRNKSTAQEMLVANRDMSALPTGFSILATFVSAVSMLGLPSEAYTFGIQMWVIAIGNILMIIMTSHILLPIYHKIHLTSIYEYLEKRYDKNLRLVASIIFILQMIVFLSLVLYAPALALSHVTGVSIWFSVLSIAIVCTFYTSIGGMRAVIWTDVFQTILMFAGLFFTMIKGIIDNGGLSNIFEVSSKFGRTIFQYNLDLTTRHTIWTLSIGGCFNWLAIYGVNQAQVQRYVSVPDVPTARKALYFSLAGLLLFLSSCMLIGLSIFTKYHACDPLKNKIIKSNEQLYPLFVMETFYKYKGVPGLFMSCLLSGTLSTISSGLNSLAAVLYEDVLKSYFPNKFNNTKHDGLILKLISFMFGIICISFVYVVSIMGSIMQATYSLFGVLSSPLLGVMLLGICFKLANTKGAYIGFFTSIAFNIWLWIGSIVTKYRPPRLPVYTYGCNLTNTTSLINLTNSLNITVTKDHLLNKYEKFSLNQLYSISYMWYSLIAVVICLTTGILTSLITKKKDEQVDSNLIFPIDEFFINLFRTSSDSKGKNKYQETDEMKPLK